MTAPAFPPDGDTLSRFVFEHAAVRGEVVRLEATWRAVLERHDYPRPVRDLLGEMMAAAALLAATLKFEGALIMQMQGSGPVSLLVVECDSAFHLRATAKWHADLQGASLRELLGDGKFVITLDPKQGGQTYQGVVALEGDSVAAALEYYMLHSEQLETRLWLAADEQRACGLLIQRLPEQVAQDEDGWNRVSRLAATVRREELLALPAREVMHRLFHEEDLRVFDPEPVSFRCACSRERVSNMLRMLGLDEIRSILAERGQVDIRCEFCNQAYVFDPVDAEQLFAAEVLTQVGATRH